MSYGRSGRLAASALVLSLSVAACGGSSSGSPTTGATAAPAATTTPTTAPIATAATTTTTAAGSCPSGATVGAALGISLPEPVEVKGGGGTQLPAGATGVACEYAGKGLNVIIVLISNTDPTSISLFSSKFPVPYKSVSGVGDQARSFLAPLNGGKDNEGVVATTSRRRSCRRGRR